MAKPSKHGPRALSSKSNTVQNSQPGQPQHEKLTKQEQPCLRSNNDTLPLRPARIADLEKKLAKFAKFLLSKAFHGNELGQLCQYIMQMVSRPRTNDRRPPVIFITSLPSLPSVQKSSFPFCRHQVLRNSM